MIMIIYNIKNIISEVVLMTEIAGRETFCCVLFIFKNRNK